VLGIATHEPFLDLGVGPLPEAVKVLGQMDGPVGGREQVQGAGLSDQLH
jgi:hypothetical protein